MQSPSTPHQASSPQQFFASYAVVGAGKSGLAAALLARADGAEVFLTEAKAQESFAETAQALAANGIEAEFGGHSDRAFAAECFIVSPGIPPHAPLLVEAERRGIPIISEIEFAWRHLDTVRNPVVAITGTNGKTTTTALTAHVLNACGRKAIACGNIGLPLSSVVGSLAEGEIIVVETSSYQLDRTVYFRPDVALFLNLSPDHLTYHGSMDAYGDAKWKVCANQTAKNMLILCADDPETMRVAERHQRGSSNHAGDDKPQILHFSVNAQQHGAFTRDGAIVFSINTSTVGGRHGGDSDYRHRAEQHKEEYLMNIEELRIPGVHNVYNSMAAALAARAFEVRNENIRDSLMSFHGVEHRLEFVRSLDGVDYINDSKATNINSTWYALSSYKKTIIWIAGGRGDNNDYSALGELVGKHVRAIVAIGEEAEAIFQHFSSQTRCFRAASFEEAVAEAQELALRGEVVLFSPACKSFDMFANYEHRGDVFKLLVHALPTSAMPV
jgi:UDP-N-acetylmuramoylalanine--D-glutamate ligase